ncbi:MAG: amidase [Rhodospirillaceae bacterium]|jgi:amidase|nr:amidase [Rhodospirillaceae bacterium]MBT3494485.1 amidase [Rhodospirillaceae bacterium]MBT3782276.1 amidase [Rhodospirillaceae bacterium]MBT3978558.1 amidase [Rhodospirillaceae bacterium]MBT4170045.1 amidase [Rhodospirillaceae bacterium]
MSELHFATATELAAKIRNREIGAVELLDHFLGRVEKYNPQLNAIIWMDEEGARARAKAADAALARGENWGPLHGLPMTIKESFNIAGSPTTWGRPDHKDNIADSNALYVDRLLGAGANIFGKTNVPINLADWQSFNEIYGTTNNPWDLKLTPGGSSGGSAAALAAGLTGLDAGSDIGASIRNPAHYCGVFGHKPTYGIVPGDGQALPGVFGDSDIAVVGPLARSAEDLALSLDIVAGPNRITATAWQLNLPAPRKTALKDFKVAVMLSDPAAEVEQSYQDCLQGVADALAKAGATVSDSARPDIDTARAFELYILLLRAATSRSATAEQLAFFETVSADPGVDHDSYLNRMARGVLLPHREWLNLDNERAFMRQVWAEFFQEWDILICPAATSAAWPQNQIGERHDRMITVNGKQQRGVDQMFWAGYPNMVFLPSTVSPAGLSPEGLPLGLQAVAAEGEDKTAIEFCRLVSTQIVGFQAPPGYE